MEFLRKFPCSVVEKGATEVEVNITTRVALTAAFVFLGEVTTTLIVVCVPEIGMITIGSFVVMDPAAMW